MTDKIAEAAKKMEDAEIQFLELIKDICPGLSNRFMGLVLTATRGFSNESSMTKEELDSKLGISIPESMVNLVFDFAKNVEVSTFDFTKAVSNVVLEDRGSVYRARESILKFKSDENVSRKLSSTELKNRYAAWDIKMKKVYLNHTVNYIPDVPTDVLVIVAMNPNTPLKFVIDYTDYLCFGDIANKCKLEFNYDAKNCRFFIGGYVYYPDDKYTIARFGIKGGTVIYCSGCKLE